MSEDFIEKKAFYKIKDVAEFLDETPATLRFWESEFSEICPTRGESGIRYYTPEDVETLRLIHYLVRTRGMRIDMARRHLSVNRKNISNRMRVLNQLYEVRSELDSMLQALKKRR